jgi:hypothetical protein
VQTFESSRGCFLKNFPGSGNLPRAFYEVGWFWRVSFRYQSLAGIAARFFVFAADLVIKPLLKEKSNATETFGLHAVWCNFGRDDAGLWVAIDLN